MPQAIVVKDFADHVVLAGLDEGEDLHDAAAVGAEGEGIGAIDGVARTKVFFKIGDPPCYRRDRR